MLDLHLDWETRGILDLREVGLHRYATHADTDLWCAAYAFGDEEPEVWRPGQPCPPRIAEHITAGGRMFAWNAPFEITLWHAVATPRYGWPALPVESVHCVMAQAYAQGLPGALEEAAYALGLKFLKDTDGRGLMLRMAKPRRIESGRPVWWSEPDKVARLCAYSQQDVRVEREAHRRLMPLSAYERRVWLMDYAINQRGVLADQETARAALAMADTVKAAGNAEIAELTNGEVQTDTALIALKGWLKDHGVPAETLNKVDVVDLLADEGLPSVTRRVLEIRQEIGKASVAKLKPMVERAGEDGRLRNLVQYHGAATGRWAGRGLQVHNFPRDLPDAAEVEHALSLVRSGDHQALALMYGPPLNVISRCLRSFLIAPPGKVLIAGDFSAVESRGGTWLAGEEWKLQAFRKLDADPSLPDMYRQAYAKSFRVDAATVTDKQRQIGKVQELLLIFGGSLGAIRTGGGPKIDEYKDEEILGWVKAWRAAHPRVVATWDEYQQAACSAVRNPGEAFKGGALGREVTYKMAGSFLWALLPSGRVLCYPYAKLLAGRYGDELTYMTVPNPADAKKGKLVDDASNSPRWARVRTYGGSLMENNDQAICRDLMADALLRLHDLGAAICLHVHDEIVVEVDEAKAAGARAKMEEIMNTPPAWAREFPLHVKCHVMRRYGK